MTVRALLLLFFAATATLCAGALRAADVNTFIYGEDGAIVGLDLAVKQSFEEGSVQLNEPAKEMLNQFMQQSVQDPSHKLTIICYSDTAAALQGDTRQSYGRALEVKAAISMLGFSTDSIARIAGLGAAPQGAKDKAAKAHLPGHVEIRMVTGPLGKKSGAGFVGDAQEAMSGLALGVGYPDVRLRMALFGDLDLEGKFAFDQGIQVYSGRLIWNTANMGPFNLVIGAEGGYASFSNEGNLNGDALIAGGSIGVELPIGNRLRLSADVGPAYMQASSEGYTYSTTGVVYNTALYFYLY